MISIRSFQEGLVRKIFILRNLVLNKLFVKKLDYKKYDIKIHIDSTLEFFVRSNSCSKEPGTVRWIENCAKNGGIFFDVGANIGAYSLISAKCGMETFAFEPSYTNFYQLNRNIKINSLEKIITPINSALSQNTKISTFNFLDDSTGTSKCYFNELDTFHLNSPVMFTSKIMIFSIDDFIEKFNTPIPNYIKIDVDGAELDVIRGASKIMRNEKLSSIQIEVDSKLITSGEVINLITASGFEIQSKINFKNNISNYVFSRK